MTASRLPHEILDRILVFAASSGTFTRDDGQAAVRAEPGSVNSTTSPYDILRTCALVSSTWRRVAQARLFSFVYLDWPPGQCPSLAGTLAARPDLASFIRTIRMDALLLCPEDEAAFRQVLQNCTRLSTFVFDGGGIDFRLLEPLKDSDTLSTIRVMFGELSSFSHIYPSNPLPNSLRFLSIPSLHLSPWIWPYVSRRETSSLPTLAWLTDSVEWLTLTSMLWPPDDVIHASHAISRHASPGQLPYPFQRLKGINASIHSKTAVEEMFPPSASEMERISIVWHIAWWEFVDPGSHLHDFYGSRSAHDPLRDAWLEEDKYRPPCAHKLEALYVLPIAEPPTRAHLDKIVTRIGLHGDPALRHLQTLFLDRQWKVLLDERGVRAFDRQGTTSIEVVFVGSFLSEEERVMAGGLADDDVGIPLEMQHWMVKRREMG